MSEKSYFVCSEKTLKSNKLENSPYLKISTNNTEFVSSHTTRISSSLNKTLNFTVLRNVTSKSPTNKQLINFNPVYITLIVVGIFLTAVVSLLLFKKTKTGWWFKKNTVHSDRVYEEIPMRKKESSNIEMNLSKNLKKSESSKNDKPSYYPPEATYVDMNVINSSKRRNTEFRKSNKTDSY